MISDYQYERISYLLDNTELNSSELSLIYDMLEKEWFNEDAAGWLEAWLRGKPRRQYNHPEPQHGTIQRAKPGCVCSMCRTAIPDRWRTP
jgi:hypothetical protein